MAVDELIERLRLVSARTNDPLLLEAAAALEAAREDARSGDWVLVPRRLPRDALNYLAGFDMDSVGNSTGDAASECWGELVSMAANEVHELEFSNPVFHAGTNLTVRRGTKWYGREWAVVKVGEARVIVKLSTMTHKLSRLDDHWLRHEHDPACRTVGGLVAEMQRVYPGFDAYEDVTLVSFTLPGPIAALEAAREDAGKCAILSMRRGDWPELDIAMEDAEAAIDQARGKGGAEVEGD